jgi:chemotaxis protein CheZ
MGHSDVFSLQDALGTDESAVEAGAGAVNGVQVWGDPAQAVAAVPVQDEPLATQSTEPAASGDTIYNRIGQLTRTLHDAMRELGYHESLADARDNLPDARDRLAYIARLTGDAAEKVLNSVDRAREVQDEMAGHAKGLETRWAAVAKYMEGGDRATPAGATLVEETCAFLRGVDQRAGATNTILTDIMMAQDFHDLTGQVIRKVVNLAQSLEEQLLHLLIESTPPERKKAETVGLEGPIVDPEKRTDVVADQAGVDDLLASLGF